MISVNKRKFEICCFFFYVVIALGADLVKNTELKIIFEVDMYIN